MLNQNENKNIPSNVPHIITPNPSLQLSQTLTETDFVDFVQLFVVNNGAVVAVVGGIAGRAGAGAYSTRMRGNIKSESIHETGKRSHLSHVKKEQ